MVLYYIFKKYVLTICNKFFILFFNKKIIRGIVMANRKVDPEKKRILMGITIQKNIKDKLQIKAKNLDVSLSEYVENLIIKELDI